MKIKITKCLIWILTGLFVLDAQAQDIHFSQFFNTAMLDNPANTGLFEGGDYRGGVIYRNQWGTIPVPFRTFMAFGDMRLTQGPKSKNLIGLGFMAMSDHAGDLKYNFSNFGMSLAYHHAFDYWFKKYFSAGLMLNVGNTTIDYTNALFESNIVGSGGVSTTILPGNYLGTLPLLDLSAGVKYTVVQRRRKNYFFGLSAFHLNQPRDGFIENVKTPIRIALETGMQFPLNYRYDLIPKLYINHQGGANEIDLGALVHLDLKVGKKEIYAVYAGAWYRVGDAMIPTIRVDKGDLILTLSYDVNMSKLYKASDYLGGPELSLIYKGRFKKTYKHSLDSPRF